MAGKKKNRIKNLLKKLKKLQKPFNRKNFKRLMIILGWMLLPLIVVTTIWVLSLTKTISDKFHGKKWDIPSKVYSDSLVLYPGMDFSKNKFEGKLKRLEYARTGAKNLVKGNYRVDGDIFSLYLHDFDYPREKLEGFPLKVFFQDGVISRLYKDDEEIFSFQLEPELIAEIFSTQMQDRKLVRLKDLPPWLPKMLVYIEDRRFYSHFGIDFRSIARAFVANIKQMRIAQGGSTITQQLMRNFFLYQKQTLWRKFVEAVMAIISEVLYDKEEILEAYMNEIWMGQKGSVSIHGFGEASRFYFGKDLEYLNQLEGAMLIGMIKSASVYSPYRRFDKSLERAKHVLALAKEAKIIDEKTYKNALKTKIVIKEFQKSRDKAPYFTSFIKKQLLEFYSDELLETGGLKIFTTLDMDMQKEAENAIREGLKEIEKIYPNLRREDETEKLQASIISLKPQTGYIKTYIGGRDFYESQFDRISMAKRQPGSLFKPFVYLSAFEINLGDMAYTPSTILEDSPVTIEYDGQTYSPKNYEEKYFGSVTLRQALEKSLNSATVRVGHEIGEEKIITMAKKLGISSDLKPFPSISLGSFEVSPLEMAQAYSIIANMGTRASLISIKDVVSSEGNILNKKTMQLERIVEPQRTYLINNILKGVFDRGTAKAARIWGFDGIAAGKTGTTNDYRDSWFVGYTPEILSLSWVGFDKPQDMKLSGSAGALRIWTRLMKHYSSKDVDFRIPKDIVFREIDASNGLLAGRKCKDVIREAYLEGTDPDKKSDCKDVIDESIQ